MDTQLQIIMYYSTLYGVFEFSMSVRQRALRKKEIVKTGDKASIWLLFLLIAIGYFLAFTLAYSGRGTIFPRYILFIAGMAVAVFGLVIRIIAILTLKQHFTYIVTRVEDHQIVEAGLYRTIRHPGYLGQLIMFFGIAVAFSNWLSTVAMIIPIVIAYLNRIQVEEKFLLKELGEAYISYQARTNRLIPGIY